MKQFLQKILKNETLVAILLILITTIVTYGLSIPKLGYYHDDWYLLWSGQARGAATQWILGIRPEFGGLRIDPCIPSNWDGFSVRRRFRGYLIHINVFNPSRVSKGVARIIMDGKPIAGNLLPTDLFTKDHQVEVWMGS